MQNECLEIYSYTSYTVHTPYWFYFGGETFTNTKLPQKIVTNYIHKKNLGYF